MWIWIIRYQKCRPFKSRLIKRASRWIHISFACFEENYIWIAFSRFSIQSAFAGLIRPSFVYCFDWNGVIFCCQAIVSLPLLFGISLFMNCQSVSHFLQDSSLSSIPLPFPISSTQFLYLPPINLYFHASFRQLIILPSFLPLNTIMNVSAVAAAMSHFISPNHSFIWLGSLSDLQRFRTAVNRMKRD